MPNTAPDCTLVHVAAGVIVDRAGKVFIAQRKADQHQGGLWEFPGGKVEWGETARFALARELREELGIEVIRATPLIRVPHHYSDKSVLLDVWQVTAFAGKPFGREGQATAWVSPEELHRFAFPVANRPIVNAVALPDKVAITGGFLGGEEFLERLNHCLAEGIRMLYLRDGSARLNDSVLEAAVEACRQHQCLLVASDPALCRKYDLGLHLKSAQLPTVSREQLQQFRLVGASCHSKDELEASKALNIDYAFFSPVYKTASHPGSSPVSEAGFASAIVDIGMPVYALGGMQLSDLPAFRKLGAQGMAAIRAFWG